MTNETGQYATGGPTGDRVFAVTRDGDGDYRITDGEVVGDITRDTAGTYTVDVEDTGATATVDGDMWAAVNAFAALTRTVEATPTGRVIASRWQSSGTVGSVLAQFASTGRARLDMLQDDADRTQRTRGGLRSAAAMDMAQLLRPDHGYREPITVRSLTEAHAREYGADLATTAGHVLSEIAESHPHLITDAASARDAFHEIWDTWGDNV